MEGNDSNRYHPTAVSQSITSAPTCPVSRNSSLSRGPTPRHLLGVLKEAGFPANRSGMPLAPRGHLLQRLSDFCPARHRLCRGPARPHSAGLCCVQLGWRPGPALLSASQRAVPPPSSHLRTGHNPGVSPAARPGAHCCGNSRSGPCKSSAPRAEKQLVLS